MKTIIPTLALTALIACDTPNNEEVEVEVAAEEMAELATEPGIAAEPEPAATAEILTLIVASPAEYEGRIFGGNFKVAEVVSDRGFYIEQDGTRMLALIVDEPQDEPLDINTGQVLEITRATVRQPSEVSEIAGQPITDETRALIEDEQAFLVIEERDIDILDAHTVE